MWHNKSILGKTYKLANMVARDTALDFGSVAHDNMQKEAQINMVLEEEIAGTIAEVKVDNELYPNLR